MALPPLTAQTNEGARPRAREAGVVVGVLPPGPHNAITDVAGVRVGQVTVIAGDSVHTGVTAILPHAGNLYDERVPAAIDIANGFGKLLGYAQVRELGELETPILLTCTLCVWKAADAMVEWLLRQPGMERVYSINPVVGETNDRSLNAIRERPIAPEHVVRALESASDGPVAEGTVGAGAGTVAFGWKGGIGTSSRRLPPTLGGWTIGVLVQTNFGGMLTIAGVPVGQALGQYLYREQMESADSPMDSPRGEADPVVGGAPRDRRAGATPEGGTEHGSIMIVVATDAPLDARNLERLARRAVVGLGRTGAAMTNGSGDFIIAFSTAPGVRRRPAPADAAPYAPAPPVPLLPNDAMSPLFQAVAEATEEAIYNSLFRATTVTSNGETVRALPLGPTLELLRRHGALQPGR